MHERRHDSYTLQIWGSRLWYSSLTGCILMAEECKENHAKSEGIGCWPFSRLIVKNVWIMDGYPYFSNIYKALIYGPDGYATVIER